MWKMGVFLLSIAPVLYVSLVSVRFTKDVAK